MLHQKKCAVAKMTTAKYAHEFRKVAILNIIVIEIRKYAFIS